MLIVYYVLKSEKLINRKATDREENHERQVQDLNLLVLQDFLFDVH